MVDEESTIWFVLTVLSKNKNIDSSSDFFMLRNNIWQRKTIICTNRVLLIHRKRSPFHAGEGIDKSKFKPHPQC